MRSYKEKEIENRNYMSKGLVRKCINTINTPQPLSTTKVKQSAHTSQ